MKKQPARIRTIRRNGKNIVIDPLQVARDAIRNVFAQLPDSITAAHGLANFVAENIVPRMCHRLQEIQRNRDKNASAFEEETAQPLTTCMRLTAVSFTKALLEYAQAKKLPNEQVSQSDAWPVLIAQDPSWDIRKAVKNPKGLAAERWAPIIDLFGHEMFLDTQRTRERKSKKQGPFHQIAIVAAKRVHEWLATMPNHRERGLPWVFDYADAYGTYAVPMTVPSKQSDEDISRPNAPRIGDKCEWAIALKYCLHLELAPEPERTQLRDNWRKKREKAFAAFDPATDADRRLQKRLLEIEALPPPPPQSDMFIWPFDFPPEFKSEEPGRSIQREKWNPDNWEVGTVAPYEPEWVRWWRSYLQYRPEAIFSNDPSLITSIDPAIVKLVSAQTVNNRPLAAFGRCVDAVLNAFLTMAEVKNGMKSFKKPLPKIRVNDVGFEKTSEQQPPDPSGLRALGMDLQRKKRKP